MKVPEKFLTSAVARLLRFLSGIYFREFRRLSEEVRMALVLLRAPVAARRLEKMHAHLLAEIEAIRHDYRQTLKPDTSDVSQK